MVDLKTLIAVYAVLATIAAQLKWNEHFPRPSLMKYDLSKASTNNTSDDFK